MKNLFSRHFSTDWLNNTQQIAKIFTGIQLVVMDIDGTVIDQTIPHYRKHLNVARHTLTQQPPWSDEEFLAYRARTYHTHGTQWLSHRHMISEMIEVFDEEHHNVEAALQAFLDSFQSDSYTPPLFPSLKDLLLRLKTLNISVLAFSNNDHVLIERMLINHQMTDLFHTIVGETNKPNPEILMTVLKRHPNLPKTTGNHILVVGDSLTTDGQLAVNIGGKFIYFIGGYDKTTQLESIATLPKHQQAGLVPHDTVVIRDFSQLHRVLTNRHHSEANPFIRNKQ